MKILYVINQISEWSGDSSLLWYSVKSLQKMGHQVAIATTDGNPFRDQDSNEKYLKTIEKLSNHSKNIVEINGISIYPAHCISSHFGMYSPNANNLAKKIIKDFDIVHIYSWYHHIGIEFFKTAKKYGIPLIFTAMGTLQNNAQSFYKKQKSIIDFLYTKKIINYASTLHSVGNSEIETYLKYGGKIEKIIKIENGINLNDFELKNNSDILKRLNMENKSYILYLGRLHKKKGIELLLNSFKILNNTNKEIYLIIAGSGENTYVQKIKTTVKDLGLESMVKFTGLVSHDEKITLLSFAKLFSLTSISDIHPRAIQEALTMGVPVVISKESDYPEVEEYNAGIIVNLDSKEICHAFEELLKNEDILNTFSNNAKKLIKDKFLLEEQVKKFEKLYQDILLKNNQI